MCLNLSGHWRVTRRIFGQNARFSGEVTIDETGRYHESGQLIQGNQLFETYRDYKYHQKGEHLVISFLDGRVFLDLTFKDGIAQGVHHCDPDVYEAHFRIQPSKWVTAYKVSGPRKNYTIVSVMRRLNP